MVWLLTEQVFVRWRDNTCIIAWVYIEKIYEKNQWIWKDLCGFDEMWLDEGWRNTGLFTSQTLTFGNYVLKHCLVMEHWWGPNRRLCLRNIMYLVMNPSTVAKIEV